MNRFIAAILLLMSMSIAYAQTKHVVDTYDLDYEVNLSVPEIPQKQHEAISNHMRSIRDALKRLSINAELRRNNEVVTITIPCSELFAPNDTVLKNNGRAKLQHVGKMLQYPTMYKVVIAVFSDNTGEEAYCDQLTAARANAIDDYFVEVVEHANLPQINSIPYGMGQTYFKVDNNSMTNREQNRRVEITIIPEWEMIDSARAGHLK